MMANDPATVARKLGERDREMLDGLIWAYDHRATFGWPTSSDGNDVWDGVSPLDCGGRDGSDHSYRLSKLCKLGLAEARKGLVWGKFSTRHRGSKKYRPTDFGRAVHASNIADAMMSERPDA